MSSNTKIVVLHMKEIIYTAIFLGLAAVLVILLTVMFRPDRKQTSSEGDAKKYTPGIYTSTLSLNDANLEVEVTVDESRMTSPWQPCCRWCSPPSRTSRSRFTTPSHWKTSHFPKKRRIPHKSFWTPSHKQ